MKKEKKNGNQNKKFKKVLYFESDKYYNICNKKKATLKISPLIFNVKKYTNERKKKHVKKVQK